MSALAIDDRPLASLEQARDQILAGVEAKPAEEIELTAALGRVLADTLVSKLTLPPWDNSAMDGFAVRAQDVAGATPGSPVELPVAGDVAAGAAAIRRLEPGTVQRIFTGAPVPAGADAIVPVEDTDAPRGTAGAGDAAPTRVLIYAAAKPAVHIRAAGGDIRAGDLLVEAGHRLGPAQLALAAAGGYGRLTVHVRPRVAVLATGDELVPAGTTLGPSQIPDTNSVGLAAQATATGAEARSFGIARDDLSEVTDRLTQAADWADVIVVSGGVSVGAHDVVKDAFEALGRVELWRVAVQPGKPVAFGRTEGRRSTLLFGLPGNPVSSFVTFELFVRPVLRRLCGYGDPIGREVVRARLSGPVRKPVDRRSFLRVRLADGEATLSGGQGSHMISSLAAANALAVIPEGIAELPASAEVEVLRLDRELDR